MIKGVVFDMDGTLLQSELLKAISYGRAAQELSPGACTETEMITAFKDLVGRPREQVSTALLARFRLEEAARSRMAAAGLEQPWRVLGQLHAKHYEAMLDEPGTIRGSELAENVAMVRRARGDGLRTALATMSCRAHALRIIAALGLADHFDFIATSEDAKRGKPDPMIYNIVSRELGVAPRECVVFEDSASGIKAAVAASMWCIGVVTSITRPGVLADPLLDREWVVDDPARVSATFDRMLAQRRLDA